MITEQNLEETIRYYEGSLDPKAPLCRNLAALYTIRDHMFGPKPQTRSRDYSGASARADRAPRLANAADSEFLTLAVTVDADALLDIMDELMADVEQINVKLYRSVLRKMRERT